MNPNIRPRHPHEIIKCVCGIVIGQCRCINPDKQVTISDLPCTHKPAVVPDKPFGDIVRHIVWHSKSGTQFETNGGLAFALGVAVQEALKGRDHTDYYEIRHPNDVPIFTVSYQGGSLVIVTGMTS